MGRSVEMIQTVWMDERHLLLDREWQPFIAFKNLSCAHDLFLLEWAGL
jgi:hypothetical protein